MINLDPQASLTTIAGVKISAAELQRTIHDTAVDEAAIPEPITVHGIPLIPSQLNLTRVEGRLLGVLGSQFHLRNTPQVLKDQYDLVPIDSPRFSQLAVLGALAAGDLIVLLPTHDNGTEGLDGSRRRSRRPRKSTRPTLARRVRLHAHRVLPGAFRAVHRGIRVLLERDDVRSVVRRDGHANRGGDGQIVFPHGPGLPEDLQDLQGDALGVL